MHKHFKSTLKEYSKCKTSFTYMKDTDIDNKNRKNDLLQYMIMFYLFLYSVICNMREYLIPLRWHHF